MKPSIWIYGGVHNDPGSRQRFIEELTKQGTAPHFVAVEWEQSVFERLAAWRPWIAEGLRSRWGFLTREDCHELSLALAWRETPMRNAFQALMLLWLENGFQEAELKRRYGMDTDSFRKAAPAACFNASAILVTRRCTSGWPTSPHRQSRGLRKISSIACGEQAWSEASGEPEGFERDARWAIAICERSAGLRDGWIAAVVGWAHADPATGNQRLRGLLLSKGFSINSVRLGP